MNAALHEAESAPSNQVPQHAWGSGSRSQRAQGARILIVEDDPPLVEVLEYNLCQGGYEVTVARDGGAALESARRDTPDLIVLDLMLPKVDGLEVCRQIRSDPVTKDILVVMLTAKGEEADQVLGFGVGADDYVTKPFSIRVLLERVRAVLRRRADADTPKDVIASQGVVIDHRRHRVMVGGEPLELTPSEYGLLATLVRQPGRAFSRGELIDAALGCDTIVLERTIDVHVRAIRRKLGEQAGLIETVRGIGYRFREPGMA